MFMVDRSGSSQRAGRSLKQAWKIPYAARSTEHNWLPLRRGLPHAVLSYLVRVVPGQGQTAGAGCCSSTHPSLPGQRLQTFPVSEVVPPHWGWTFIVPLEQDWVLQAPCLQNEPLCYHYRAPFPHFHPSKVAPAHQVPALSGIPPAWSAKLASLRAQKDIVWYTLYRTQGLKSTLWHTAYMNSPLRKRPYIYLLTRGTEAELTVCRHNSPGSGPPWSHHPATLPTSQPPYSRRGAGGCSPSRRPARGSWELPHLCLLAVDRHQLPAALLEEGLGWWGQESWGHSEGKNWQGRQPSLFIRCVGCGQGNFITRSSSTVGPLPGRRSLSSQQQLQAPSPTHLTAKHRGGEGGAGQMRLLAKGSTWRDGKNQGF